MERETELSSTKEKLKELHKERDHLAMEVEMSHQGQEEYKGTVQNLRQEIEALETELSINRSQTINDSSAVKRLELENSQSLEQIKILNEKLASFEEQLTRQR